MKRTSTPVASRSWNHGTMFAWCSISVTRTTSPAAQVGGAPGAREEVERLGRVLGEDDLAGAAGRADEARHRSRASPRRPRSPRWPSGRRRGARWRGAARSSGSSPSMHRAGLQRARARVEVGDGPTVDHARELGDVRADPPGVEAASRDHRPPGVVAVGVDPLRRVRRRPSATICPSTRTWT